MQNKFLDKFDITIVIATILMVMMGVVSIFSATYANTSGTDFYLKQMIFGIVGFVIMIIISFLPPKYFSKFAYSLYILSILLLILVLVFGKTINGNKSWFYVGGFGIQPSEFAKIATILALANFISPGEESRDPNKLFTFVKACIFIVIPAALIKLEHDTGTTLVMLCFIVPMFFWAGISPFWLFAIISPLVLAVLSFLNPTAFYIGIFVVGISLFFFKKKILISVLILVINLSAGFSVHYFYSKLAIGSGGITGKGYLQGSQTQLKFIPEQWTDFIFCMIGEEFGLMGAGFIVIVFFIIIYRLISIAYSSKNKFLALCCIGFASLFLFHLFINVGMTIGMMPVIGIPLPLVSYGVSSLLTFMAMIGIALNAYRHKNLYIT
jgi:rod shape determining protein RodA